MRQPEVYSSEELLEVASEILAYDLEDGYELESVDTTKDVTQQTRRITMELEK